MLLKRHYAALAGRPVHLALAEHMQVDVVDGLATHLIAVHGHAEATAATQFVGQPLGGIEYVSSQITVFFPDVVHGADVLFRNH